jgi:hypothetical protein
MDKDNKALPPESMRRNILLAHRKSFINSVKMFRSRKGWVSPMGHRLISSVLLAGAVLLALAVSSSAADIPCVWTGVERTVAVGDLHGDYDNFVTILKQPKVGLLDENLHWIGGKTHLVQIGDVLDRGDKAKEIFDLLMRLEKEAAIAGGMVHVLLGNHEETNITGVALSYPEYVFVDQFLSFLPKDFKTAREKEYVSRLPADEQARIKTRGLGIAKDPGYHAFWEKILEASKGARGRDEAGQAYANNFNRTDGKWLLKKNVVIKINDIIFVHAGINFEFSAWKLRNLNDAFRMELEAFALRPQDPRLFGRRLQPKLVYNSEGPLWPREMERNITQEQMDKILTNLKVSKMVIGHNFMASGDSRSPVAPAGDVIPLFRGKVWMIDTGIGFTPYGGRLYALIIKDGEFDHYDESEEAAPANPEAPQAGEGSKTPDEVENTSRSRRPFSSCRPGPGGPTLGRSGWTTRGSSAGPSSSTSTDPGLSLSRTATSTSCPATSSTSISASASFRPSWRGPSTAPRDPFRFSSRTRSRKRSGRPRISSSATRRRSSGPWPT